MKVLILNGGPKKNGATNKVTEIISEQLLTNHLVDHICLGEKRINYCIGCKACYINGECCQEDDVISIVESILNSDVVLTVVPSYWAEVPGQMKVFIDRCTPYSNTNPNRIEILHKTMGYSIVIRTGLNPIECEGIIKSINHYYGHMEIKENGSANFCGVNNKEDIEMYRDNLILLCEEWFAE
jgi:multimeric flavodoxin WrbA